MKELRFIKLRDVESPAYGTEKSAGIDFFVPNDFEERVLFPGHDLLIPSGIRVKMPENTMMMGADKSGVVTSRNAKLKAGLPIKGFDSIVIVGAKIIDEDYPGEIHIHIINVGMEAVRIKPGMKIAQFIIVPVIYANIIEVQKQEDLGFKDTSRISGFGSTNK